MAGKPKKPEGANAKDPEERAIANLQYVLDRTCNFIHDGPSSYAVRARRAAKNGVPRGTIEKGLDAIRSALKDAEEAVERAYSPKAEAPVRESRVVL